MSDFSSLMSAHCRKSNQRKKEIRLVELVVLLESLLKMVKFVNILLLASAVTAFSLEKSSSRISSQNKIRSSLQGSLPRQDIHSAPTFLKATSDASIPEIVAAATPAEPVKKASFIDAIW